jgi:hypothetical protein
VTVSQVCFYLDYNLDDSYTGEFTLLLVWVYPLLKSW